MSQISAGPVEAVASDGAVEVEAGQDEAGDLVEVTRPVDSEQHGPVDLGPVAVIPALLLAGNTSLLTAATSWHAAGATGLAGAAVVTGVSAAAGAGIRRAHRAEAARRAAAEGAAAGKTGAGKTSTATTAGGQPRTGRAQRRADRLAARRAAQAARPVTRTGQVSRLSSLGPPAAGGRRTRGLGLGLGRPGGRGPTGRGLGRAGTAGRGAAGAGGRRSNGAGSSAARSGLARLGSLGVGRGTGLGRGGGAGLLGRRRGAGAGIGAGGGGRLVGAVRRAGAAGSARVGRGTHAVAGSRPVRRAAAVGRRAAAAVKQATQQARSGGGGRLAGVGRALGGGRAAWRGARAARGRSLVAMGRSMRSAMAAHRKQSDKADPRHRGAWARLCRRAAGVLVPVGIGAGVGLWRAGRGSARWSWWGLRAGIAKARYQSVPDNPRRRDQARAEADAAAAAAAGEGEAAEHPPVAEGVVEPAPAQRAAAAAASPIDRSEGEDVMGRLGLYLEDLSGQMGAAAAVYDPSGMQEWGQDVAALEKVLTNVAGVLTALQRGADDLPIEPAVKGTIGTVAGLQLACASAAAEIHSTFRMVHADELARLENPRPGEHKWDTGSNQ